MRNDWIDVTFTVVVVVCFGLAFSVAVSLAMAAWRVMT